jgi:hypothetical protein
MSMDGFPLRRRTEQLRYLRKSLSLGLFGERQIPSICLTLASKSVLQIIDSGHLATLSSKNCVTLLPLTHYTLIRIGRQ